jgi:hypothetical protein
VSGYVVRLDRNIVIGACGRLYAFVVVGVAVIATAVVTAVGCHDMSQ